MKLQQQCYWKPGGGTLVLMCGSLVHHHQVCIRIHTISIYNPALGFFSIWAHGCMKNIVPFSSEPLSEYELWTSASVCMTLRTCGPFWLCEWAQAVLRQKPIMPSPCDRNPKRGYRKNSADLSPLSNVSILYVMRTWISQIRPFTITAAVKFSNKGNVGCIHMAAVASWDLLPLHPSVGTAVGAAFFTVYYNVKAQGLYLFNGTSRWYFIATLIKTVNHVAYWDIVTSHLYIPQTPAVTSQKLWVAILHPWPTNLLNGTLTQSGAGPKQQLLLNEWLDQNSVSKYLITILLLHVET